MSTAGRKDENKHSTRSTTKAVQDLNLSALGPLTPINSQKASPPAVQFGFTRCFPSVAAVFDLDGSSLAAFWKSRCPLAACRRM
jgi:hypothetical protein